MEMDEEEDKDGIERTETLGINQTIPNYYWKVPNLAKLSVDD